VYALEADVPTSTVGMAAEHANINDRRRWDRIRDLSM